MIVHCPQCKTGFFFDERLLGSEGAWMRCSRCRRVFFHETSRGGAFVAGSTADDAVRGERRVLQNTNRAIDEINRREYGRGALLDDEPQSLQNDDGDNGMSSSPRNTTSKSRRALKWSLTMLFIYLVFVVCIVGGVYLWLFSDIPALISGKIASMSIPFLERAGKHGTTDATDAGRVPNISFSGIKDSFASNWMLGTVLVVQGTAVNNSSTPVSDIKVKGRVFNAAGEVLAVSESYCGNILSEDELSNMTAKEIREELARAEGSTVANDAIPVGGTIPFMLVYINPAAGVDEISIELAGVKRAPGSSP